MNEILKNIKCYLLDMDGTIYLSGIAIDGAIDAVERMRKSARVIFLTNNTSSGHLDYVNKLNKIGFNVKSEDIYTAGDATIDYLSVNYLNKKIFLLGTNSLREQFCESKIILNDKSPDLVVVGFDTSLTYANLEKACTFIREGVPYILTHPDINCPTSTGYIPDVGSFLALIETSTQIKPIAICGKPYAPIADGVKRLTNLQASEIAMVGDRLSTDMQFACNNGFVSVLVLSGEATMESLEKSGLNVDVVFKSIANY